MKEFVKAYYQAIIEKDEETLKKMIDNTFQIIHINGMIQNKEQFINAVINDNISYYAYSLETIQQEEKDDKMVVIANVKLVANLYRTGKKERFIQTKIAFMTKEDWKIYRILETSYR